MSSARDSVRSRHRPFVDGTRDTHGEGFDPHRPGDESDVDPFHLPSTAAAGVTSHDDLTDVSADDHHAESHAHDGADGSGTVSHDDLTGVSADDHHAKSHAHSGADGSGTVAHSATTGQTADDHHAKSHAHNGADGSGTVAESALTFTDITTNDVSITKHGFAPKAPNSATKFLDGTGAWDTVKETDLSLSDVTTNDVSTTKHGLVPKAPNDTTMFLRGDGTWAVPTAGALTNSSSILGADVAINVANSFFDLVSLTLAAGTWLILGQVTLTDGGLGHWTPRIYDGTNAYSDGYNQSGQDGTVTIFAIVSPTGSTTYKLQVASTTNSGTARKSALNNGQNKATQISAIKIG